MLQNLSSTSSCSDRGAPPSMASDVGRAPLEVGGRAIEDQVRGVEPARAAAAAAVPIATGVPPAAATTNAWPGAFSVMV